jgi:hypothetical protein
MQFFRNTALALATGYILFFFSERLFWSTFRPGDHIGDLAIAWLAYSVLAYLFLSVVSYFRAEEAQTVFVAGALFGWLAEGGLVGTLYGTEDSAPFPFSLICTGLSWHALISVLVGWHFLRRSLAEKRSRATIAWASGVGVFWGTWATFLWHETPPVITPISKFAIHAVITSGLLMFSYITIARIGSITFRPRWLGLGFSSLVLAVFFSQQVKTLGARPLIVLPILLGLVLFILAKAKKRAAPLASEGSIGTHPPFGSFLLLLFIPVTATLTYSLLTIIPGWRGVPIAQIIMFWVTAPASVLVLAWALITLFRKQSGNRLDYKSPPVY